MQLFIIALLKIKDLLFKMPLNEFLIWLTSSNFDFYPLNIILYGLLKSWNVLIDIFHAVF